MKESTDMKSRSTAHAKLLLLITLALSCTAGARAQAAPSDQKGFDTPKQAADALITAAESYDKPALMQIFGPKGDDFIDSADTVHDKDIARQFAEKAKQKHFVSTNGPKATLLVGKEDWPLPIPLVNKKGKWYFDTAAGRDEILFRRIGGNELDAIQICRGYVEAQKEYASTGHDGSDSDVRQYAQRIISSPGKQDGLYWKNPDGSSGGPITEGIARALQEGYSNNNAPFHGYYFKVLNGQGPNAPLGKLDYVVNGLMIGGFALVAVPAEYKVTGVKTFLVSQNGVVYEKDLGPDSLKLVQAMTEYNPDKTWQVTKEELVAQ